MLLFLDAIFMFYKFFEEKTQDYDPPAVHAVYPIIRALTMVGNAIKQ